MLGFNLLCSEGVKGVVGECYWVGGRECLFFMYDDEKGSDMLLLKWRGIFGEVRRLVLFVVLYF